MNLAELEKISTQLENLEAEALNSLRMHCFSFLSKISTQKAYVSPKAELDKKKTILNQFAVPSGIDRSIEELFTRLLSSGVNTASGGFLGYVPGGGVPLAAVGDFISALLNRYSGFYQVSPGNTEIENEMITWMIREFDFGPKAWGTLTSGGTIATLSALVVARDQTMAKDYSKLTVYMTEETHSAVKRSLKVAGLAQAQIRMIGMNENFQMDAGDLNSVISDDVDSGFVPLAVVATAGTTNTGAVDPLRKISIVCRQHDVWFHVDGAYGGFFQLTEGGRKKLDGISFADSLVLDPHKSLFMPYGCGAVLFKDASKARKSFSDQEAYLKEAREGSESSPADYSIELTRHSRGPRVWLPFKIFGVDVFRAALEEKLLLAKLLANELKQIKDIELACEPDLSCVTFRILSDDKKTLELLNFINDSGEVYLTSTRLNELLFIRSCILSFRTHKVHIDKLLVLIKKFRSSCVDK